MAAVLGQAEEDMRNHQGHKPNHLFFVYYQLRLNFKDIKKHAIESADGPHKGLSQYIHDLLHNYPRGSKMPNVISHDFVCEDSCRKIISLNSEYERFQARGAEYEGSGGLARGVSSKSKGAGTDSAFGSGPPSVRPIPFRTLVRRSSSGTLPKEFDSIIERTSERSPGRFVEGRFGLVLPDFETISCGKFSFFCPESATRQS